MLVPDPCSAKHTTNLRASSLPALYSGSYVQKNHQPRDHRAAGSTISACQSRLVPRYQDSGLSIWTSYTQRRQGADATCQLAILGQLTARQHSEMDLWPRIVTVRQLCQFRPEGWAVERETRKGGMLRDSPELSPGGVIASLKHICLSKEEEQGHC